MWLRSRQSLVWLSRLSNHPERWDALAHQGWARWCPEAQLIPAVVVRWDAMQSVEATRQEVALAVIVDATT